LDVIYDGGFHGEDLLDLPSGTPKSSLLWATIQTELLTYRRVGPNDPWISQFFSMDALRSWLTGDKEVFATPLVEEGLMSWTLESSCCGWFVPIGKECFVPLASEACIRHFMNMDVYERTKFLLRPEVMIHCFGTIEAMRGY